MPEKTKTPDTERSNQATCSMNTDTCKLYLITLRGLQKHYVVAYEPKHAQNQVLASYCKYSQPEIKTIELLAENTKYPKSEHLHIEL